MKKKMMSKSSTLFLKSVVFLLGAVVLFLCAAILPQGILSDQTGYYRPILIGMYLPAIPFFIALYQGLKLLSFIEANNVFSHASIRSLQIIKYCAGLISICYTAGMPYIFSVADRDDAPGVVLIGFIFIFASLVIAVAASVFQKLLQNVVDIKSENDLTV